MAGSRKIEMVWRCGRCGTENKGRDKVCVSCGDPKDPSERYQMPSDTARAPTVTDAELLRKAKAGRDWCCERCGAHVSALHAQCTQCGAARQGAAPGPFSAAPRLRPSGAGVPRVGLGLSMSTMAVLFVLPVALLCGLSSFCAWTWRQANAPEDVATTVSHARWERTVAVERWAARSHEGFVEQRPADAFEIRSLGMRRHHDDQVIDHYKTEHYTVAVPDGVDRVPYTERVKCGEDCEEKPKRCREVCDSDDNGFATCRTKCTGGGRKCEPRYCKETRYREVPRTRPEQRTRQVPVYRKVPVEAELFSWKAWGWVPQRTVVARGDQGPPSWPSDEEVALNVGLASGEKEQSQRREVYDVQLVAADGRTFPVEVRSEETFARFAVGSAHVVRIQHGKIEIDPSKAAR